MFNGYKYVTGDIAFPEDSKPTMEDYNSVVWDQLPEGLLDGRRLHDTIAPGETDLIYAASASPIVCRDLNLKKVKAAHTDAILVTGSSVKDGSRVALIIDIPDQTTYLKPKPGADMSPEACVRLRQKLQALLTHKLKGNPATRDWISDVHVQLRSPEEPGGFEPVPMFAISALNHEVHKTLDNMIREYGIEIDGDLHTQGLYDLTSVSIHDWVFAHYGVAPFKVYELTPGMRVSGDGVTTADREYRCGAHEIRVVDDPTSVPGVHTELLDALHIAVMDIETMAINPDLSKTLNLDNVGKMKARGVDDHGFPQSGQSAICQIGLGVSAHENKAGRVTGLPGALDDGVLFNLGPTFPTSFGSERLDNGGNIVKAVACSSQPVLQALFMIAMSKYKPGVEMGYNSHEFDWPYIDDLNQVMFESVADMGERLFAEYGLKRKQSWSNHGITLPNFQLIAMWIVFGNQTKANVLRGFTGIEEGQEWVVRTWLTDFIDQARERVAFRRELRQGLQVLGYPGDGFNANQDRFLDTLGPNLADGVVREYVPDWDARMEACEGCFYRALNSLLSWVRPGTNIRFRRPGVTRTPDRLHTVYLSMKKKGRQVEEHKVFQRKFVDGIVAQRTVRVSWSKQSGTRKATFIQALGFQSVDGLKIFKNIKKTENEYGLKYTMRQAAKKRKVKEVLVLEAPYDRITPRMVAALKFAADLRAGAFTDEETAFADALVHLAGAQNLGVYCGCSDVPATLTVVADLLGLYKAVGRTAGAGIMDFYMGVSRIVRGVMYDKAHRHNTSFPPKERNDDTEVDDDDEAPGQDESLEELTDHFEDLGMPEVDLDVLEEGVRVTIPATSKKDAKKKAKKLKESGYTGATVLFMRRGRYPGWVIVMVIDFGHLYPAIMISNAIGASSMIETPKDMPLEDFLETQGLTLDDVYRPTMRRGDPVYRRTVKYIDDDGEMHEWRGTLAETEESLLEIREHYKGIMKAEIKVLKHLQGMEPGAELTQGTEVGDAYAAKCASVGVAPVFGTVRDARVIHSYRSGMGDVMQLAAKVICNSGYGFVGQKTSFLPTACAGSVTGGGMTVIMVAKGMMESLWRVGRRIPSISALTTWADGYRHLLETEGEAARGLVVDAPEPIVFNGDIMSNPRPMWDGLREWALAYSKPTVDRYYKVDGSTEIAQLEAQKKLDNRGIGQQLQKRARELEGSQTLHELMKRSKRMDDSPGAGSSSSSSSSSQRVLFCDTCTGCIDEEKQAQLPKSLRDIGCVATVAPGSGPGYHLHRPLETYEVAAGECPLGRLQDASPNEMEEAAYERLRRWCEMRLGDLSKATPERVAAAVHPDRIDEALGLVRKGTLTSKVFETMQPPCGVWFDATTVYGDTDSTFVACASHDPYVAHFVCEMVEALTRLAFVVPKDLIFEAEKFFMARPQGLVYDDGVMKLPASDDPMFPGVKMTMPDPDGAGFWGKTMKQYAALKVEIGRMFKIAMSQTGLVGKKRGVPPEIKKYLGRVLNEASLGYSLAELEAAAAGFMEDMATGKYNASYLRVTAAYNPEKEGRGKALAEELARHGINVGPGTRISWYYGALGKPGNDVEAKAVRGASKGVRVVPYAIGVRQGIVPDYPLYVEMAVKISNEYLRDAYPSPDECRLAMARLKHKYVAMAHAYLDSLDHVGRVPLTALGLDPVTRVKRQTTGIMAMFNPTFKCHCGAVVPEPSAQGRVLCPDHAAERIPHLQLEIEGLDQDVGAIYDHCRTQCPIFAAGTFEPQNCMEYECTKRVQALGKGVEIENITSIITDLEDLVRG